MSGVYIVEFDIYPGLYKIGKSKDIENRVKQFQNSTILLNNNVKLIYCKEFENYTKAERDIHNLLKEYRCSDNREFFKGDINQFITCIDSLDPSNYRGIESTIEEKEIHVSQEVCIYLLQYQIEALTYKIKELEEKEQILCNCLKDTVDILKSIIKK